MTRYIEHYFRRGPAAGTVGHGVGTVRQSGRMVHEHDQTDVAAMFSQAYWDERYGSTPAVWSGRVNQRLAENVADRAPGTALELGCGEGADAIWLAEQGWQVTAVDVSPVVLARAAHRAEAAGADIAARITWQQADLLTWDPAPAQFDLVSEQFLQLPSDVRARQHRRWAAAVRPGGLLLIVGHHPSDMQTAISRPKLPDLFFTAEDEAAALEPTEWIVVASAPQREASGPDCTLVTISDAVLRAERRL
jgi:SAM-dependent methyltransferase